MFSLVAARMYRSETTPVLERSPTHPSTHLDAMVQALVDARLQTHPAVAEAWADAVAAGRERSEQPEGVSESSEGESASEESSEPSPRLLTPPKSPPLLAETLPNP